MFLIKKWTTMTVSADQLLSPTYTAPQSSKGPHVQRNAPESMDRTPSGSSNKFQDHLNNTVNEPKKSAAKPSQSTKNVQDSGTDDNAAPNTVNTNAEQDSAVESSQPAETIATSEAPASEQSEKGTVDPDLASVPTASEKGDVVGTPQNADGANDAKAAGNATDPQSPSPQKGEQVVETTEATAQNDTGKSHSQNGPSDANLNDGKAPSSQTLPHSNAADPQETATAVANVPTSSSSSGPEGSDQNGDDILEQQNKAPAAAETKGTGQKSEAPETAILGAKDPMALPSQGDIGDKVQDTVITEVSTENAENTERNLSAPQQQVVAGGQALSQVDNGLEKPIKNAGKNTAAENNAVANATEAQTKSKSSDTSAKGDGQASSDQSQAAQSRSGNSTATPAQGQTIAKPQFQTELTQSLTAGETKPIQVTPPPLQTALLTLQEVGQNTTLNPAQAVKTNTPHVTPQMVTNQISLAISKQAANGQDSFRISLKPADLGHVDIKMDFQSDGRLTATVTVDNERSLNLLQKDQASLEKALENAGFNTGGNNLNFNLKEQQQNQDGSGASGQMAGDEDIDDMAPLPNSIINRQHMKIAYSDNALDIQI